jgi:hypothetical protein
MSPRPNTLTDGPMIGPPERPSRRRWPGLRTVLIAGAVLAVLLVFHRPLLTRFALLFRVDDPAPSDALIVLVGWTEPLEIYQRGWAPQVLMIPHGQVPFPDLNQSEVDRQVLIRKGIPENAIRALPAVSYGADIREVAQRVREELEKHPLRRITITAGAAHSRRVRRVFRRALHGMNVDIHIAAVRDPGFDETNWYRKDEGLTEYFSETIEVIRDALAG